MTITAQDRIVNQGDTFLYTTTLKDETGTAISLARISTAKMTLYLGSPDSAAESASIINSRNEQDIKNANNVTIHATSGLLSWAAQTADTAIQDSDLPVGKIEIHTARIEIVYDTSKKSTRHVWFGCKNVPRQG